MHNGFSRSLSLLLGCTLFALAAASARAAPSYVQSPPLTEVVKAGVQPVQPGPVQVPLITWGGDIATIHANGDRASTAKGSLFDRQGLDLRLVREDKFTRQLADYLSGKTPYLRGTLGMINMAAELLGRDPRTKPVVIAQLTWSAGGDALVVPTDVTDEAQCRALVAHTVAAHKRIDALVCNAGFAYYEQLADPDWSPLAERAASVVP